MRNSGIRTFRSLRVLSITAILAIGLFQLSSATQASEAHKKKATDIPESTAGQFAEVKKKSKSNIKKYSMRMKKAHLPTAPHGGTDDYRCFLLDPKIKEDSILRSIEFIPQKKDYVHHAIMFRVSEANIPEAIEKDKSGIGWPCFGGSGLGGMFSSFVTSPWISAWAPGRGIDLSPEGYGIPFRKGERLVLQIHYNLLAANGGTVETDRSRIVMEAVPASSTNVKPLTIELFAAPVELACPSGVTGPLCDRNASLRDLATRTDKTSFLEAQAIAAICGKNPAKPIPSLSNSCDRIIRSDFKIIAAGPHMHLLGKKLKMTLNPGTEREKSILNVENYDFDDQSPIVLPEPINVASGDVIRIECVHDPSRRQVLPALKFLPPRYVTWGEGSSDEMCLGVLSVTRD